MYKNIVIILSLPLLLIGYLAHFIFSGLVMGWKYFQYAWEVSK